MIRCINLDWLEVFAIEPAPFTHDANYFRSQGFIVEERGYGTRMYKEMFTIFSDGTPWIEIRRNPLSVKKDGGLFDNGVCHIRLSNRTCYADNPINIIRTFIDLYQYTYKGISRIDVCLDFCQFDHGDNPKDFISRYISGKFSKINQTFARARWDDTWTDRFITWVSWGLPSSMVSTKIYLKSRELKNVGDKPWIRQAWQLSGLVNDMDVIDKDIWRVEFAIKAGTSSWVQAPSRHTTNIFPNNLTQYDSKYKLMFIFFSLANHYFHFKKVEFLSTGKPQRKDRCADKILFDFSFDDVPYKLNRLTTAVPKTRQLLYLLKNLIAYSKSIKDERVLVSFNAAIDWITATIRGEQSQISTQIVSDIFCGNLFETIKNNNDAPFIGDNFEDFVYQYAFNKQFMSNNKK